MTPTQVAVPALAEDLAARRVPFVAALVVRAEPPTSAHPGDRALVLADGEVVGFVGGQCVAGDVRRYAARVLDAGRPLLLRVRPGGSPTGVEAAGAEGSVEAGVEAAVEAGVEAAGTVAVHNPCLSGGALDIFLEPRLPPPLLVVAGSAPIATALVDLARCLGYAAIPWAGAALPGDTAAVVVASHGRDEEAPLRAALHGGVPYVGLVASRHRGAAVLAALDLPEADRRRVHTPAGLDLGARTPGEVALSILAQIVAERPRGRPVASRAVVSAPPAGTALDPVCGMTVEGSAGGLYLDRAGTRWWFCGPGCRDSFAADPDRYAAR